MTKTCHCGDDFEVPDAVAKHVSRCPACVADTVKRREADSRAAILASRKARWVELCPKLFLGTKRELLPQPRMLDRVLAWKCGKQGLLLHGPTGTGKSRCAWKVMERECLAGRRLAALNAAADVEYAASFERGAAYAAKWFDRLVNAELLLLDDVFKAKMTDSFQSLMFKIVSVRGERELPLIIALNDTGESIGARLSADRSDPMLRRMRQDCAAVNFAAAKKEAE